jgi:flagellar protein FliT
MDPQLLPYYEAIERASAAMLEAARTNNWDEVVRLEGACVLLISQLRHAADAETNAKAALAAEKAALHPAEDTEARAAARAKSRIMQRILVNDAEIRQLAEPWLAELEHTLAGRRPTLH